MPDCLTLGPPRHFVGAPASWGTYSLESGMTQKDREEDEAQLFLDSVKDVKPIKHQLAEMSSRLLETPVHERTVRETQDDLQSPIQDGSTFLGSGIQTNVLRKLRNGSIRIEAELDLHGYSSSQAEPKLRAFIHNAQVPDRQRAVRVIHGKGVGSPNGKSVLRDKTQQWLREYEVVLAFCPAGASDGGTGALHVLLRRK